MNPDYKNYSLENIKKWVRDSLTTAEATPQEIYDAIHKVVEEEYYYFKHYTGRCYDLLTLLKGNGKGHLSCNRDDQSEECKSAWDSFWKEDSLPISENIIPPLVHSDMGALQYTEEEMNAMCTEAEKENSRKVHPDFDRNRTYTEMIASGYTMTADGFWIK